MSFLYFEPGVFVLVRWSTPVPNFTKNPLVYQSLPLSPKKLNCLLFFNSFEGAVKTLKTNQSFISIQVSGGGKLMRYLL